MKNTIQIYKAAIYLRLSKEQLNGTLGESDSIVNQEALIRAYLQAHPEIEVRHVFKDDGWSGVDFDRPGFQKMMQKIYDGAVDCVIVKDLSRLGRNHTETGKYISRIFPAFGVRFIAVNDHVDTANQNDDLDNIIIPFKDLLNDSYSRDISIKTRSTLEMKRRQGLYVGSITRFGYAKDEKDKNKLVIDEEAADIVRKIFRWCMDGMGNTKIAEKLNEMNFPAPAEYRELKRQGKKAVSTSRGWYPIAINRILRDETYTGVMTQGKFTTPNYKVKKVIRKSKDEVARIENAFEPIISKKEFEFVQQLLERDVRTKPGNDYVYPLCGYLFCADCGGSMIKKSVFQKGKLYEYYVCGEHKYNRQVCSNHNISVTQLENAVLEAMNLHLQMLLEVETLLDTAELIPLKSKEVEKYQLQIAGAIEEKYKYQKLMKDCYIDYKEGLLTESEYVDMKQEYESRIEQLDKSVLQMEEEKKGMLKKQQLDLAWVREFRENPHLTKLSRRLVTAMIDRVLVYSSKKVRVVFTFEDEIRQLYERISSCNEEDRLYG
jgi:DNA invertase Pin-like site-specific DNA recombinase